MEANSNCQIFYCETPLSLPLSAKGAYSEGDGAHFALPGISIDSALSLGLEKDFNNQNINTNLSGDNNSGSNNTEDKHTQRRAIFVPIRSIKNIFIWVTTLERLKFAGVKSATNSALSYDLEVSSVHNHARVLPSCTCIDQGLIFLEEYAFIPVVTESLSAIAKDASENFFPQSEDFEWWRKKMINDLVLVSEECFNDLMLSIGSFNWVEGNWGDGKQVDRKLDAKDESEARSKTVAVFTLPPETIFASEPKGYSGLCQFGVNLEYGHGFCRIVEQNGKNI